MMIKKTNTSILFTLTASLVLLLGAMALPSTALAVLGDGDWGVDCCDSTPAPSPSPDRDSVPIGDPDRTPSQPALTCTLSADKTTVMNGESVNLTVTSTANTAILYKITGWRGFLIFRRPVLSRIGNIPINTAYTITPSETTNYQVRVQQSGYTPGICRLTITVTEDPTPPPPPPPPPPEPTNDPTCTISASPSTVESGGNTTLSWSSSNATSASIDNSIGTVGTVGSYSVGNITSNTTYTMTVTGASNSTATCSTSVAIATPPQHQYPSCNVWVTPSSIEYGEQTTLHWSSSNATSMSIPSIGSLTPNTSGSRIFYNLTADRSFECRAYDADGHLGTDTARVTVEQYTYTPPTCSLFASPINITTGGDSTLSWNTTNATSVTLSGMGSAPLNGTKVIYNLQNSQTYTLTATGPGGTAVCSRTINVSEPYVPPVVPPTKVRPSCQIYPVYINRDITASGGGAILNWTIQNATSATLTDHGTVSPVTGTQFVKPTESKTYTLTVFNDGYRASCSTRINVADRTITDYTPTGGVTLTSVPYTGAEDYAYLILLLLITLTLGFVAFFYRDHIRQAVAPRR